MPPQSPPLAFKESMHARYQAVGMIMGDQSSDFRVADQEELMRQSSHHKSAAQLASGSTHSYYSNDSVITEEDDTDAIHIPETEEAVRERFRAATMALQDDVEDMDEEQQLKHREKEEREFLNRSAALPSSTVSSASAAGAGGMSQMSASAMSQSDQDAKAKAQASSVTTYQSSHSLDRKDSSNLSDARTRPAIMPMPVPLPWAGKT